MDRQLSCLASDDAKCCTWQGLEPTFEPLIQQLLDVTYIRATAIMQSHRQTVGIITEEMLSNRWASGLKNVSHVCAIAPNCAIVFAHNPLTNCHSSVHRCCTAECSQVLVCLAVLLPASCLHERFPCLR